MLTLLLGFAMLQVFKSCPNLLLKMFAVLPFAIAAEYLRGDYGYLGILVIAVFAFTRQYPNRYLWQFLLLWLIFSPIHMRMLNWTNDFNYEIQQLAALAIVPFRCTAVKRRRRASCFNGPSICSIRCILARYI